MSIKARLVNLVGAQEIFKLVLKQVLLVNIAQMSLDVALLAKPHITELADIRLEYAVSLRVFFHARHLRVNLLAKWVAAYVFAIESTCDVIPDIEYTVSVHGNAAADIILRRWLLMRRMVVCFPILIVIWLF